MALPGERLDHLLGARFLCAAWVLCGRFLPDEHAGFWLVGKYRLSIAEDFFVVLSGFVMQWSQSANLPRNFSDLGQFYFRRLARVLLAMWIGTAWSLGISYLGQREVAAPLQLLRCALLIENWGGEVQECPDSGIWPLAALLPCWLLFPFLSRLLASLEAAWRLALPIAAFLAWLAGALLALEPQAPLAAVPNFCLGAVAAALSLQADDGDAQEGAWRRHSSRAGDAAAFLLATVVIFTPRAWPKAFLDCCAGPLVALFLTGSAVGSNSGLTRLLQQKAFVGFGAYTFQVFIFQDPLYRSFEYFVPNIRHSAEGFVAFMLLLWLLAGLYAEQVEAPLMKRLGSGSSGTLAKASSERK
eukprot:TRINITY_DN29102_c0_g2_i1.p1 TRINITY_DN29102_c0_g2~~TRINITY_DN29102_c0_g2_i1.p1  ORF type:complete len:357 (+),score=81.25 TRINITY_DN29102_c0_g2_i1:47-1117(+)